MRYNLASYLLVLVVFGFFSCGSKEKDNKKEKPHLTRKQQVEKTARLYFQTFAERKDWEKLLSFYSDTVNFEDVLLQTKIRGKEEFKEFYDWPNPSFKKLSEDQQHLVVEDLAVSDSAAVARGYLNPFYFNDKLWELKHGGNFTIWLYFDDNLKIRKQVDWFEYPSDVMEHIAQKIRDIENLD